jgi:glycerate 2-kinase
MKPPHVVIACDKFKGSLSANEACAAVRRGLGDGWTVDFCPIADGGEGFVATMIAAMQGVLVSAPSHDALGREISADYGIVRREGQTIAIIEMAAASGMWRIKADERDVMRASTFGTGELIRHAIERQGADAIILGIGGSATNDGGAGMAAALGLRFFDAAGNLLDPWPGGLCTVASVDVSQRMSLPPIQVACDVDNPLCGERGASAIYGPQKGASAGQVILLEKFLQTLVRAAKAETQALVAGAGAAGGLGFGLMAFAGAKLVPGFAMVAEVCELRQRLAKADVVITGEGSLDAQSLAGKGPVGIARLCKELGVPCVAVAGVCSNEIRQSGIFDDAVDLISLGHSRDFTMRQAAGLMEARVNERLFRWKTLLQKP